VPATEARRCRSSSLAVDAPSPAHRAREALTSITKGTTRALNESYTKQPGSRDAVARRIAARPMDRHDGRETRRTRRPDQPLPRLQQLTATTSCSCRARRGSARAASARAGMTFHPRRCGPDDVPLHRGVPEPVSAAGGGRAGARGGLRGGSTHVAAVAIGSKACGSNTVKRMSGVRTGRR
jgi:hypothetical protein